MSRYLVMRRTMTGSYEDCHDPAEPIEADSPEDAQAAVGDGLGVYRVVFDGMIDDSPPEQETITYVHVEATISRRTHTAAPPPLAPDETPALADAREQLRRGLHPASTSGAHTPDRVAPLVIDPPAAGAQLAAVPNAPTSLPGTAPPGFALPEKATT